MSLKQPYTVASLPFMSQVERFVPFKEVNLNKIGPGSYLNDSSLLINESFNAKGYGNSFISKTGRFTQLIKNKGPGPGTYHQESKVLSTKKERLTSSFKSKTAHNRFTREGIQPGPGDYNPIKKGKGHYSAAFVFKSRVARLKNEINDNPAPGQYLNSRDLQNIFIKKNVKPSPSFMKKEISSKKQMDILLNQLKKYQDPLLQNQNIDSTHKKKTSKSGKNALLKKFKDNKLKTIKENNNKNKKEKYGSPGPGSYISLKIDKKEPLKGCSFKSKVPRCLTDDKVVGRNLGPGCYQNTFLEKKKDFHYNAKQGWV